MDRKKTIKASSGFPEFKRFKPWQQMEIDFPQIKENTSELRAKAWKDLEPDKVDVDGPEQL